MSHFLTGVAGLVRDECRTSMLYDDMTLARLMVHTQSIEEYKHWRMTRSFKSSGASDQGHPRYKKRA